METPAFCPMCGGEIFPQQIEHIVRGDTDTAIVKVICQICVYCGYRQFSQETLGIFEHIKKRLLEHDTTGFQEVGVSYKVDVDALS